VVIALADLIGHRGPEGDRWNWLPRQPDSPRRPPRRRVHIKLVAAVAAIAAVSTALALGAFLSWGSDDGVTVVSPTASAEPEPTATPAPPPLTPTPPSTAPHLSLSVWANERLGWLVAGATADPAGYKEGEAIPFMVRVDDTSPGEMYVLTLRYECAAGHAARFDFLTGYDRDAGGDPVRSAEAPGRLTPDAAIPVPDDPSIILDDRPREEERLFRLWGGTFEGSPIGPEPETPCADHKAVQLNVRAQGETLFLLWGGHLASSADWGVGQGAADGDEAFSMSVESPDLQGENTVARVSPSSLAR